MAREMHDERDPSPPFVGEGLKERSGSPPLLGEGPGERSALALQLHDALAHLAALAAPGAVAGIGVDVVEIAAFDALPFAAHAGFYTLTFAPSEIAYCRGQAAPAQHFAARFAAKEAVVKACGGLITLSPAQVEIARTGTGAPLARIHDAPALADIAGRLAVHVSLGHSERLAYATALAVHRDEPAAGDEV